MEAGAGGTEGELGMAKRSTKKQKAKGRKPQKPSTPRATRLTDLPAAMHATYARPPHTRAACTAINRAMWAVSEAAEREGNLDMVALNDVMRALYLAVLAGDVDWLTAKNGPTRWARSYLRAAGVHRARGDKPAAGAAQDFLLFVRDWLLRTHDDDGQLEHARLKESIANLEALHQSTALAGAAFWWLQTLGRPAELGPAPGRTHADYPTVRESMAAEVRHQIDQGADVEAVARALLRGWGMPAEQARHKIKYAGAKVT
jgi:hypothetical protein